MFLTRGVGFTHWGARPQLEWFEAHDVGLAASILGVGYLKTALVRCRTGLPILAPGYSYTSPLQGWDGSGFEWYDTHQAQPESEPEPEPEPAAAP